MDLSVGDVIEITNPGQTYDTHPLGEELRSKGIAPRWKRNACGVSGDIGIISYDENDMFLIQTLSGEYLMSSHGIRLLKQDDKMVGEILEIACGDKKYLVKVFAVNEE